MTNSVGRTGALGPTKASVQSLATMQRRHHPLRPSERWESHLVTFISLVVVLFDVEKFGVAVKVNDQGESYLCMSRRGKEEN